MNKKVKIGILILLAIILLTPLPIRYKDGGTVEYRAILYGVTDVHTMAKEEDVAKGKDFYEGIIVRILFFEVFNNVDYGGK